MFTPFERQSDGGPWFLMFASAQKTLILGPEHDDALRGVLRGVLKQLGARSLAHDRSVGGSQELETAEILMGVDHIVVEARSVIPSSSLNEFGVR